MPHSIVRCTSSASIAEQLPWLGASLWWLNLFAQTADALRGKERLLQNLLELHVWLGNAPAVVFSINAHSFRNLKVFDRFTKFFQKREILTRRSVDIDGLFKEGIRIRHYFQSSSFQDIATRLDLVYS